MDKFASKYLVFFIAALVSVTIALPHIYGYVNYKSAYTPFNLYERNQYQRDELYAYVSQVQQIKKGHLVGDAYIWENRSKFSPFLSEFISVLPLTAISFLTGNINIAFVLSDLLFPALLLYILFNQLKKRFHYLISLSASLAVVFMPQFSTLIPYVAKGGYLWTGTINDTILFSRTPHPQISIIYLFLTIFLAASTLESVKNKRLTPLAILASLSLYTSAFISTTTILGLLFLSPLLLKNVKKTEIIFATATFAAISLPWLINFILYSDLLNKTDFFLRVTYPKEFLFPRQIRYIFFGLLLLFLKKDKLSWAIISFVAAAGALMDMHQVFTGRSLDADHWISRVMAPICTMAIILAAGIFAKKTKLFILIISSILLLVLFVGISAQVVWITKNKDLLKPNTKKTEIFNEIKKFTSKDDVIASTSLDLNQFITGATGRYVYIAPPERALMDSSEQLNRICDVYKISRARNLSSKPDELLDLELNFQKWKLSKEIEKEDFLSQCINKQQDYYKIDFIIDKKPDDNYELIKY